MKRILTFMLAVAMLLAACGGNQPGGLGTGDVGNAKEKTASKDKMKMVFIAGGSFQMGGLTDKAQPDEEPDHKVTLKGFWLDQTEVTNAQYALCVAAGVCEIPRELKSATRPNYYTNPEFADYPVIYVTWNQAKTYCEWAGRRLPTEAEWEYAARGNDFRNFPWGDADPTEELANFGYKNKDTVKVGSYPKGASPFGVLDMAGNVWEWIADFYSPTYYQKSPAENPTGPDKPGPNGLQMVVRGGSWADDIVELRVSNRGFALAQNLEADKLSNAYAGQANDRTGFRCAADE
ncbi:MAG: formylglycine-generating enzyme family protein [Anaerolineales bacterium]|nr:formylglycine-generating enzyme family protein [Anaerolineales bacterium]MDW8276831.1 formylglycine-generating enzyme family protein [Anaerolineales bacterium]